MWQFSTATVISRICISFFSWSVKPAFQFRVSSGFQTWKIIMRSGYYQPSDHLSWISLCYFKHTSILKPVLGEQLFLYDSKNATLYCLASRNVGMLICYEKKQYRTHCTADGRKAWKHDRAELSHASWEGSLKTVMWLFKNMWACACVEG